MSQHFTILSVGGKIPIDDLITLCGLMGVDHTRLNRDSDELSERSFRFDRRGQATPNPRSHFTLRSDCPDPGHDIFNALTGEHARPDPYEIVTFLVERSIAFVFTYKQASHVWQHGAAKMAIYNPLLTPDGPIICWCDNGSVPLIPAHELADGQPVEQHPAMITLRLQRQFNNMGMIPDAEVDGITDVFADAEFVVWPGTERFLNDPDHPDRERLDIQAAEWRAKFEGERRPG